MWRVSVFLSQRGLLRYLEQEADVTSDISTAGGARDAIQLWAKLAEEESSQSDERAPGRVRFVEVAGAQALALFPGGGARDEDDPLGVAWHDYTSFIVSLQRPVQTIEIDYSPEEADENRLNALRNRFATPEHRLETILDWRGYFGRGSAVIDGWNTMRRRGKGFVASLRGTFGFLVASVLRRQSSSAANTGSTRHRPAIYILPRMTNRRPSPKV